MSFAVRARPLFAALALFASSALAETKELASYRDFDVGSLKDTWVVFDVDNTLLRQDHEVGTHQWGDYIREEEVRRGVPVEQATQLQHAYFQILQPFVKVVPVESDIHRVLYSIRQARVPLFALTARSLGMAGITQQQLAKNGMDFEWSFPRLRPGAEASLRPHLFRGILFSGDVPKGELLKRVVEGHGHRPKRIVFVDDRQYNLDSIEKSFAGGPIEILGLRYGGADAKVKGFDPLKAKREWAAFLRDGRLP